MELSSNKNLKIFLNVLALLEYGYLLTFFFILYVRTEPIELFAPLIAVWLTTSYMILPVMLFKNVLVAILNNGFLTRSEKVLTVVRSALYVLLTICSYPLLLAI